MAANQLLYLSQAEVQAVDLSMQKIIQALETAFKEKGAGQVEMPPKPGVHPGGGDNFIHAMPAYIPALESAGVKWVSGFPGNQDMGLPYITGLLIYNDTATGLPLAVMDCVWITGMRTGAASALSARHLARPDSAVMGVLGCGVQGRTHVEAMQVVFPLQRVMAYDISEVAVQQFKQEIEDRFDLEVVPVPTPREAVTGCDIIVTAGPILKIPHATIQKDWMDPGAFASLVDFDAYWHPAAMAQASKFCTDDTKQLQHYQQIGYFKQIPEIHADLGELVAGLKPGRQTPEERTMTSNLGLAINDMAVAPLIYNQARDKGLGTWLPL